MTNNSIKTTYDRACAYPFVTPEMFEKSSLIDLDNGKVRSIRGPIAIQRSIFELQLDGSDEWLPTYDIILANGRIITEMLPIAAIGSNISGDVTLEKLGPEGKNVGGICVMLQATCKDHLVVHGAFIGAAGTIPATIVPDQGSSTRIGIGFYSKRQADAMTGTEPNYNLSQLQCEAELCDFEPSAPPGVLAFVSPWGAFTKDGQNPIALDAIPSTTTREKASSQEMVGLFADIIAPDAPSPQDCFNQMGLTLDDRLRVNAIMLKPHALPATIAGTPIKFASITGEAVKRGLPAPEILYTSAAEPA